MATQIQKLIQENPKNSEKMDWKDDFQWIKKDLIGNHPPPAGTEAKGEGQTSSEEPSTHQILIPGYNGKDITLNSTATQILDSSGNFSPTEKEYANDRLSGKIKVQTSSTEESKNTFNPLEDAFQNGGSHQYSPPASKEVQKIANFTLMTIGATAATGATIGFVGGAGISSLLMLPPQLAVRFRVFLILNPTAEKWFNRAVDFGKGYFAPATEAPKTLPEMGGITVNYLNKIIRNN